jgi:hypothetical protein
VELADATAPLSAYARLPQRQTVVVLQSGRGRRPRGGVLKPREPLALPEHTEVVPLILPVQEPTAGDDDPTGWQTARRFIGLWRDAPADDLAERHDDHLYGRRR